MSVKFVAEVSSNHGRDLERSLAFVDEAKRIGADAVKFQLFRVNQLFAPEVLDWPNVSKRKAWELPYEFLAPIAERCRKQGIQFACTPFDLEAVEKLTPHVAFFKIASYELLWHELLVACAKTGKPLVLSTGMANEEEIGAAVEAVRKASDIPLTLLHAVSAYPTPPEQANLATLETLRKKFDVDVGWSDHTVSPAVIERVVHRWGAEMVEFHLDLDGAGAEFESGHCWRGDEIKAVIERIRIAEKTDGSGIIGTAESEHEDRDWRADPSDGLRPLKSLRKQLLARENA